MVTEDEIREWIERIDEEEAGGGKKTKRLRPFEVLYEDADVIVLNKSAGISVIPERDPESGSLKEAVEEQFGRTWTVHRIDKDTSGVVLFARNEESHRKLNEQFRVRTVSKVYDVVVQGEFDKSEERVDIPLGTDPGRRGRIRPSATGKEALTILRPVEVFRGCSHIEASPETGRQHQIRVHCQAVNHPLLVDPLYGGESSFYLSSIKRNYRHYGKPEKPLIDRLTLHARELTIVHPTSGQEVTYRADPAKDFSAVLTQLRKLRSR